jgi:glycosyltransferase involved in cell wall biosynthesis
MFQSSFTGIGRYTFELVKHVAKLSQNQSTGQQNEYVLFLNNPEYDAYTPPSGNIKKVLVDAPHYSLKEQTNLLKAINVEDLDLMHFTHFNAPIRYNKPFIVTIHDLTHTLFPGKKMTALPYRLAYKAVVRHAVKKAKKIIAVSKNTKNDIIKIHHIPSHKIEVIYEAVGEEYKILPPGSPPKTPTSGTTPRKSPENTPPPGNPPEGPLKTPHLRDNLQEQTTQKPPFLLYTGVHRYHKNLPRLIEAFAKISPDFPELKLIITGKHDPLYPEAENATAELGLQEKVIFAGLVPEPELIALYNLATAYVFPSLYEGFGLPVLEAMKCGTPVIASNVSSIPEIAGPNNALFFDPENTQDIADKITQLITDPNLQTELIEKGLQRVSQFSWEKMAKETLNLYNELPRL